MIPTISHYCAYCSYVPLLLSMRHSGIPFFGYYPAAKAITSLLKVAANLSPQSLLPGK